MPNSVVTVATYQFEGSNYNGKQLYEQSSKELDPEEAEERRTKLQELEDEFEKSIASAKKKEAAKQARAARSAPTPVATATAATTSAASQNPRPAVLGTAALPAAAAAGAAVPPLPNDNALLRAALARNIPSTGLGLTSFPGLPGTLDRGLLAARTDPLGNLGIHAATLRGVAGLPNYGQHSLARNLQTSAILGIHRPTAASLLGAGVNADSLARMGYGSATSDLLLHGLMAGIASPNLASTTASIVSFELLVVRIVSIHRS